MRGGDRCYVGAALARGWVKLMGNVAFNPHPMLVQRPLTSDQQHRALGAQRVGDARDRVGGARPAVTTALPGRPVTRA